MPPKILFIMHLPPPVHGASMVGKYIKESNLINSKFEADYINLSTSHNLEGIGGMSAGKLLKLLRIQGKVLTALSKKKYDLCYMTLTSNGPGFYKDLMVVSVLKLFGKKIIYHFHNKGIDSVHRTGVIDTLYRFVFKDTFSILLSPHLYSDIRGYVLPQHIFYCPNGIPGDKIITNKNDQSIEKTNTLCQLLFLGNMMTSKGAYVLLEACKNLNSKSVPFECNFVGGWADIDPSEFRSRIFDYGLTGSVFVHGPKYDQEKRAFLENCDIFVFPTFYHFEAFPLVTLEAMQYQLPVISCPEGGIPDIVIEGETGFLVPQQNVELLSERIQNLIENPELRSKMGLAGKKRFEEFFRLETFEHNMKGILSTAIESSPD